MTDELNTHLYDVESGHYLSQDHQRIAEIIHDYDPDMSLVWIPPADRAFSDTHPYAIIHRQPDGRDIMVMKLTEIEMGNGREVLVRLWNGDTRKHDVFSDIMAHEAAAEVIAAKKRADELEERQDMAKTILKSPLHTYKHNGRRFD